jgi:hypothetical protein
MVSMLCSPMLLVTPGSGTASSISKKPAATVKKLTTAQASRLYQPTSWNPARVIGHRNAEPAYSLHWRPWFDTDLHA